jgi:hypothetical protein
MPNDPLEKIPVVFFPLFCSCIPFLFLYFSYSYVLTFLRSKQALKDCLVTGTGIASASLKTLIMFKCKISCDFSIAAPNLLLLCLITPYIRVPSFKNLGSLVTGTIILDNSYLGDDFEHISDEDDCDETTEMTTMLNMILMITGRIVRFMTPPPRVMMISDDSSLVIVVVSSIDLP